jgi:hypothetical protein
MSVGGVGRGGGKGRAGGAKGAAGKAPVGGSNFGGKVDKAESSYLQEGGVFGEYSFR